MLFFLGSGHESQVEIVGFIPRFATSRLAAQRWVGGSEMDRRFCFCRFAILRWFDKHCIVALFICNGLAV